MRLRLPELLDEKKTTAYAVARSSGGRINESTLYRLTRQSGAVRYLDTALLEALCDVLGVEPAALLTRAAPPKKKAKRVR